MNKMLRVAYDHGGLLAIKEYEKLASAASAAARVGKAFKTPMESMGFFQRLNFNSPLALQGAGAGALAGGIGGFMNAEDGHGFRGFLTGAAGGGLLGGAVGRYGGRMLMGDNAYSKYLRTHRQRTLGNLMAESNPNLSKRLTDMSSYTMKRPGYPSAFEAGERSMLAGSVGAGLVGGLGAASLSGANDRKSFFG